MAKRLNNSTPAPQARGSVPGDNIAAMEEAERIQLISIMNQLSTAEQAIELAKGPLKAANAGRKRVIGLGKAAGFTAKELERRLEEMQTGTRENAAQAERERKQRRWLGILEPDQAKLILGDSAPAEAKDEAHWRGEGYKAGLRGLSANLPDGMASRFTQPFLQEHARGTKESVAAMLGNAPKPLRQQAAEDFAQDRPELPSDADEQAEVVEGEVFDLTDAELQAQTPRRTIQDAHDERTSGEPVV